MALTDQHIRNIFIYVLPKFFSYGINLITLPILTRLLAPREFGIIALAWMFPSVAVCVLTCGLSSAAQRYYFEYRDDDKKMSAFIFSVQVFLYISLILSSVAVFFLKDAISMVSMGDNSFGMAIFITFVAGFLANIVTFYLNLYQNMGKAAVHSLFTIVQGTIIVLSGLVLVMVFKLSYMGVLYGSLLGSAVVCFAMMVNFNKPLRVDFNSAVLWDNIKYGLQVVPKTFATFVTKFFDKYMLNNMLSLSVVGIYNIGQMVGNAIFFLMGKVWSAFQPVCYGEIFDKGDSASDYVGRLFTKFAYVALTPVLLLILFAQELVYVLAPEPYYGAINVIIVLVAGNSTQIFGKHSGVQYAYSKKAYWLFPIVVAGTLLNVGANIVLIPRIGLMGAAASTCIFYLFINVFFTVIGQKLYKISYEWGMIALLYSVIISAAVAILYLRSRDCPIFYLYLIKASFIGVFYYVGVKAGVITRQSVAKVFRSLLGFLPKGKTL